MDEINLPLRPMRITKVPKLSIVRSPKSSKCSNVSKLSLVLLLGTILIFLGRTQCYDLPLYRLNADLHVQKQSTDPKEIVNSSPQNATSFPKLVLTPLIQSGRVVQAKEASLVRNIHHHHIFKDVLSYSGFFNVDLECQSNLFFWFFPAVYNTKKAPLILWHGGGPGSSGISGIFVDHGPFIVDGEGRLKLRTLPWTLSASVLYLDSPVGTGFSDHLDKPECYVKTTSTSAKHVFQALTQFYKVFPEFKKNEMFIFTGSYGGKFAPAIAYEIHTHNQNNLLNLEENMNFKGLLIASGFTDPISQIDYGDFYHNVGIIDAAERDIFRDQESLAKANINKGNWGAAFDLIEPLVIGLGAVQSRLKNTTGIMFPYNMLSNAKKTPACFRNHVKFLNKPEVRYSLHVDTDFSQNSTTYKKYASSSPEVYSNFREDIYQSVKPLLEDLLDYAGVYRFLIVSNQLDLIVPHSTIANFLETLHWRNATEFRKAKSRQWITDEGEVGGYVKGVDNFTYLFLRNSGHIWIKDQPLWAFEVMKKFTEGKEF